MTPIRDDGWMGGVGVLGMLAVVPIALVAGIAAPVTPVTHLAMTVLAMAGAVLWCVLVVIVGRLVVDRLRGRPVRPESGPLAWAAVRIATVVLVVAPFLEGGVTTSSARHPHGPVRRTMPAMATMALPAPPTPTVCTVRGGDTLEAIAERLLGDASRWSQLAALNLGRTMADGQRFSDPNSLVEGWTLRVTQSGPRHGAGADGGRRARGGHRGTSGPIPPTRLGTGAVLVPLAADVRRRARMRRRVLLDDEGSIDVETALLGVASSPAALLTAVARCLQADGRLDRVQHVVLDDGTASLDDGSWAFDPDAPQAAVRCLVVVLGEDARGTHLVVVPRGSHLGLGGRGSESLLADSLRVSAALGLGRATRVAERDLLHALATRDDDQLVVCEGPLDEAADLAAHCVSVSTAALDPMADVGSRVVRLRDGRDLDRGVLAATVRSLLDGALEHALADDIANERQLPAVLDDRGVVVRLLTAIPRVDGLAAELDAGRERRAVELVAYLSLRAGEPVTGDRLRVRVLGSASNDAAAKTLFNVASSLRRSLGDGPFGPRLPAAGRVGHYVVAPDVRCDVDVLHARVAQSRRCSDAEERIAWLRAALELVEAEPFATVLEGYDWFLAEGHLTRLQTVCEDAACELVELSLARGLVALAGFAVERARLVDPYSERLAEAAMAIARSRQASFEAIAPAARSTEPSAPSVT